MSCKAKIPVRNGRMKIVYQLKNIFYRKSFGIHFTCHHQVDDHNNHCCAPNYPERSYWQSPKSASTTQKGFSQEEGGGVAATLKHHQDMAQEFLENTIWLVPGYDGILYKMCISPRVIPCEMVMVRTYQGWYETTQNIFDHMKQAYQKQCYNFLFFLAWPSVCGVRIMSWWCSNLRQGKLCTYAPLLSLEIL